MKNERKPENPKKGRTGPRESEMLSPFLVDSVLLSVGIVDEVRDVLEYFVLLDKVKCDG